MTTETIPVSKTCCWVPTRLAVASLGVSGDSLRRYARQGLLELGRHYRPGPYTCSPWVWNLHACQAQLLDLALERQQQLAA